MMYALITIAHSVSSRFQFQPLKCRSLNIGLSYSSSSTGLCFTRHVAIVTKLSKSSLHAPSCPWSLSVPCIFPERIERSMRVLQRLSVLQAT